MSDETTRARLHELKVLPKFFEALVDGRKTFEARLDDRGFAVGDALLLREYAYGASAGARTGYTGREITRTVSYVLRAYQYGVRQGFAVLALSDPANSAHAETVERLEQRAAMAEMMLAQKQPLTRGIDRALRAAGFNYGENVTIRDGETIAAALIDRLAAERDALTAENATLKEALAQWERDYSDYGRAAPDGKRDPMSDQTGELHD